jgi:hypothetical protein
MAVAEGGFCRCPLWQGPICAASSGIGDTGKIILQMRQNLPDLARFILNILSVNSFLPQGPAWMATQCAILRG